MDFLKKVGIEIVNDISGKDSVSGSDETWYITAVRAEGVQDKDLFSKSDPYLVINFGGKSVHTKTINNDLSPVWNETFTFNTSSSKAAKGIHLKLMDKDVLLDDAIGTADVSGADLPVYSEEEKHLKIPVSKNQQIHGIIHLKVKKVGGASNPYSTSYQQQSQQNQSSYQQQQACNNYPPQSQQYQSSYQQQPQPFQQSIPPQQNYPQSYQPQQNNMPYYGQQNAPYGSSSQGMMPPPSSQYASQNPSNQPNNQPYNQNYNQGYNQGYNQYDQNYRR